MFYLPSTAKKQANSFVLNNTVVLTFVINSVEFSGNVLDATNNTVKATDKINFVLKFNFEVKDDGSLDVLPKSLLLNDFDLIFKDNREKSNDFRLLRRNIEKEFSRSRLGLYGQLETLVKQTLFEFVSQEDLRQLHFKLKIEEALENKMTIQEALDRAEKELENIVYAGQYKYITQLGSVTITEYFMPPIQSDDV